MENILKEIDIEIKKIASSEEINTQKLFELINMRDKLKGYNVTSVAQVERFNTQPVPSYPILGNIRQHQGNSFSDSLSDVVNLFMKSSSEQLKVRSIIDLIHYYKFISELEMSTETEINNERFEIKNGIESLIIKEFKNIINERKNKEKDKIIETTLESKEEVT